MQSGSGYLSACMMDSRTTELLDKKAFCTIHRIHRGERQVSCLERRRRERALAVCFIFSQVESSHFGDVPVYLEPYITIQQDARKYMYIYLLITSTRRQARVNLMGGSLKLAWRTIMSLPYPWIWFALGLETFCLLLRRRGLSVTVTFLTLWRMARRVKSSEWKGEPCRCHTAAIRIHPRCVLLSPRANPAPIPLLQTFPITGGHIIILYVHTPY